MWLERTNEIIDWICVTMFILGMLGNSLGLIIFSSRKYRGTTYARLAISSLVINLLCVVRYSLLLHSTTRLWLTHEVAQSWFNCKLYRFSSCLRILSSLVIVTWTYERFSSVTIGSHFVINHPLIKRYKFYFIAFLSLIIIAMLTGPNVYFYEIRHSSSSSNDFQQNSSWIFAERSMKRNESSFKSSWKEMRCALKDSINPFWREFLVDVRFGFNYTTLRSIFSEIIPSCLVLLLDIGIIFSVLRSQSLMLTCSGASLSSRPSYRNSFQNKERSSGICLDGLMVHNRRRTSWMNIVLILHSVLFCFSSLTATIVHWLTSNILLSHWSSVVILGNCSLNFYVYCLSGKSFRNEIRKLFYRYFQIYCFGKCLNLFRNKTQRDEVAQMVRMRLVRHRSTIIPPQTIAHLRANSFASNYY